jgi:hypothetical protein
MKGFIYKLYCLTSGLAYYGSTINPVEIRLIGHKYNPTTSSDLIIKNNNYKIEVLEEFDFNNKTELLNREKFYILNNDCVNKNIPLRTKQEWYLDNNYKDKLRNDYNETRKEQKKQYYIANKAKRLKYQREYLKKKQNILNHINIDENIN